MIYGAGGTGEFTKICRLIKKGLFPKVGRGKNLTPIVNVRDVVQAAILAGDKGKLGEMYLITSNKSYELDEIKKLISRYLGIDKRYPYVPYKVAIIGAYSLQIMARLFKFTPMVTSKNIESTVTDRTFSIAKAKNELGYEPKVELEEGIQETIQWYTDNKLL
jgi:nucleoside-diphosphate-sugar epimerase